MDFQEMYQMYDYYMRRSEQEYPEEKLTETKTDSAYDPTWVNEVFATEQKSYYNAAKYIERQLADF